MLYDRIQAYLRVAASRGRDVEQIGPFLATFSRHSDNPFINYAIPADGAMPTPADVAALVAAYERHERTPRLEYIAQLAPAVEAVLLAAGFVVEGRVPLMTCTPDMEQPIRPLDDVELVIPATDRELLGMAEAQNEAYGGPAPQPDDIPRMRASAAAGQINVLARIISTGVAAGGGGCTAPHDGITEVAGVGVRAAYRRRGIAEAITTRLAHEAFAAGVSLAFLMAAGEAEARIYRRAGFADSGEVLMISRPRG